MKIKKFLSLLTSAVLSIGCVVPTFAHAEDDSDEQGAEQLLVFRISSRHLNGAFKDAAIGFGTGLINTGLHNICENKFGERAGDAYDFAHSLHDAKNPPFDDDGLGTGEPADIDKENVGSYITNRLDPSAIPNLDQGDTYLLEYIDGDIVVLRDKIATTVLQTAIESVLNPAVIAAPVLLLDYIIYNPTLFTGYLVLNAMDGVFYAINYRNYQLRQIDIEMQKMGLWDGPFNPNDSTPDSITTDGINSIYDGRGGSDIYVVPFGNGLSYLHDTGGVASDNDTIVFDYDCTADDFYVWRKDADLYVQDTKNNENIVVLDHFSDGTAHAIEKIKFGDGTEMNLDEINKKANTIYGSEEDDELVCFGSASAVFGFDGNDSIKIESTENNDSNVIYGGKGDDTLCGGKGNDVFLFDVGDGNDVLSDDGDSDEDFVYFSENITPENIKINTDNENMYIAYGENDKLTLKLGQIEYFNFSTDKDYTEQELLDMADKNVDDHILGDISGDGAVDGSDATLVLKYYASVGSNQPVSLSKSEFLAADVDKSGAVDGSDATLILKYYSMAGAQQKPEWGKLIQQ